MMAASQSAESKVLFGPFDVTKQVSVIQVVSERALHWR